MTAMLLDPLSRGDSGPAVVELQMRLAGFHGTVPDGSYGPGTEIQVTSFQKLYMGEDNPNGRADAATMAAIVEFATAHPVDFEVLRCPCGQCGGFGKGRFRGLYRSPAVLEVYHRYEYPGMHRMLLWAYTAAQFFAVSRNWQLMITSGYRCAIDNANHQRSSTNHHGKAIDIDIIGIGGNDKSRCNTLRGLLVENGHAQIGWSALNRKSLEPTNIAPTWVHLDVRSYHPKYLDDSFFVRNLEELGVFVQ
jgi:hypothetical protein